MENNHELIRRIIPKGISLKPYNQSDYNKISSHINSLYRKKLDGKCPFDLIGNYIPVEVLKELNIERISEDKVNLTPQLLGDKNIENIKRYLNDDEIRKSNISLSTIYKEGEKHD